MAGQKKKTWIAAALGFGVGEAKSQVVTYGVTIVWPVVAPIVTGIVGWATNVGAMWIMVGMGIMFGVASLGTLTFQMLRYLQTPEDKLRFRGIQIQHHADANGRVTHLRLGIQFDSIFNYPMDMSVVQLRTSAAGRLNQSKKPPVTPLVSLPAHGNGFFSDDAIDISGVPMPGSFEGEVEYRIAYGRPGHMDHELSQKYRLFISVLSPANPINITFQPYQV